MNAYKRGIEEKCNELIRRLSEIGLQIASARFETAMYDGDNDESVFKKMQEMGPRKLGVGVYRFRQSQDSI